MDATLIIGLIGIIIAIVLLIVMAYKGVNVIAFTLIAGLIVCLTNMWSPYAISAESGVNLMNPLVGLGTLYMKGFVGYFEGYFLLMLFSVVFARMMADCGACEVITECILKVVNRCKTPLGRAFALLAALGVVQALLQAGGINPLVSIFVVLGFAIDCCKKMELPWRLAYLTCWGSSSPIACFMPGSPFSNNLIPAEFFGSKPIAMPVVTLISLAIGVALCLLYTYFVLKKELPKAATAGEGFLPSGSKVISMYGDSFLKEDTDEKPFKKLVGPLILAIIPMIAIFVCLNVIELPAWVCMLIGSFLVFILHVNKYKFKDVRKSFIASVTPALDITAAVGALVGFGIIVQYSPSYNVILTGIINAVSQGSSSNMFGTLWILVGVTSIACGVTASATGGLQAVLQPLAPSLLATGINPGILHRVTTMTTGIFDSLPHSSAIINGFKVFGVDHKMCYKYVFVETVLITFVMTAVAVVLFSIGMAI